jgi:hypothetical protein
VAHRRAQQRTEGHAEGVVADVAEVLWLVRVRERSIRRSPAAGSLGEGGGRENGLGRGQGVAMDRGALSVALTKALTLDAAATSG